MEGYTSNPHNITRSRNGERGITCLPYLRLRLVSDLRQGRFPGTDPFFLFSKYSLSEWLINSLSNEITFNRLRSINRQMLQVVLTSHNGLFQAT